MITFAVWFRHVFLSHAHYLVNRLVHTPAHVLCAG